MQSFENQDVKALEGRNDSIQESDKNWVLTTSIAESIYNGGNVGINNNMLTTVTIQSVVLERQGPGYVLHQRA